MRDKIMRSLISIIDNLSIEKMDSFMISKNCKTNIPATRLESIIDDCNFMDCESHNYHEIAIMLEGRNIIELQRCCHVLNQKEICIIEKNTVHKTGWLRSDPGGSYMLWIIITERMIRLHSSFYSQEQHKIIFGVDIYDINDCLINEIIRELEIQKEGYQKAISRYFSAFLMLLLRNISSEDANTNNSWSMQIIREIQLYIQSHLDSKLSLHEISNRVALSPNYLSILYKQITGKNISNYIHEIKTDEAKKLLKTTSLTLLDIAKRLGYYDQFHFSKVFKEYAGQSPRSYRESCK